MQKGMFGLFVVSVLTVFTGCMSYSPVLPPMEEGQIAVYRLRPLDTISVTLRGIPEGQQEFTDVIDENGEITLLHLGAVKAAGLTTSELESKIRSAYIDGQIYKMINVAVTMYGKNYYMQGEVRSPGQFPMTGDTTLMQAIAASGGFTEYANERKIQLTRGDTIYVFDGKELERNPEKDPKIEAGDLIKVQRSIY